MGAGGGGIWKRDGHAQCQEARRLEARARGCWWLLSPEGRGSEREMIEKERERDITKTKTKQNNKIC